MGKSGCCSSRWTRTAGSASAGGTRDCCTSWCGRTTWPRGGSTGFTRGSTRAEAEHVMSRRDEEKRRRRQKRLTKRRDREPARAGADALEGAIRAMEALERQLKVPAPARWPGASDPSLARPDRVKFELATFAAKQHPGLAKLQDLEYRLSKGLLADLPELDHWAVEEFLWHGQPGDPWQPVEAFLEHAGARFPPAAQAQLRRWKEARVGLYEIGDVADDTVW